MAETTKRARQAQATKRAIFEHALELFAQRPYEQIAVKDICEAAGVSVGAFYHHFKGKDTLLDEGYRVFDQQLEREWDERPAGGITDDVHFLIDFQVRALESMGPFAAAQYFKNQLSVEHAYMLDARRALNTKLIETLRAGVDQGILLGEPDRMAEDILCASRGIIYDWCLHNCSYDLVLRSRRFIDILLEHYRSAHSAHSGTE